MRDGRGFTLIELIVVIAIMGIIAGGMVTLTFPLLKMQKKTATEKELNEIKDALKLYYIDHGCFPNATSWANDLEPYAGKSASDLSKDGWRHSYHYFEFKPFRPKDRRVQQVNLVSYGANNKREGKYRRRFPGKKNKGSDDILVSVSYSMCTPEMVEKTKTVLEEAVMRIYSNSKCGKKCASSSSSCGSKKCKKCMRRQTKKYSDAWGRILRFDQCNLSAADQCSCIIYSDGVDPTTDSDNIGKVISWGIGSSGGGGSKGKGFLGPPVRVGPPLPGPKMPKGKGHHKWW